MVLLHQYHEHHLLVFCIVFFILLMNLVSDVQFLNITFFLLALLRAGAITRATVIVPLTTIMHRYNRISLTLTFKF